MLAWVKRRGLLKYGALGQTYVRTFDLKWLRGRPADEPLIGSGDIQSLADLGNSYGSVEQMRVVPMSRMALLYFVLAIVAPILPLALTMTSAEDSDRKTRRAGAVTGRLLFGDLPLTPPKSRPSGRPNFEVSTGCLDLD